MIFNFKKFFEELYYFAEQILIFKSVLTVKIKEFIKQILYRFILKQKNINFQLNKKSQNPTALYVRENMSETEKFKSKFKILDYAIKNITIEDGSILEFGVYKGGTINYIAHKMPNSIIYGFDSFKGLPEDWRKGFKKGKFNCFKKLPKVRKNIKLYSGWFEDTIPKYIKENNNIISYMHIDCDLYSSTKLIFDHLTNFILSGTIIVFDEYFNYSGFENGEYLAFKEFIKRNDLDYVYLAYNSIHEQVAIKII